ncbi:membrane protein [Kitasatospora phosalacinea]|uniref:Membrane protein n=1 Tax=Kitasatospora phosalacinea TaxID=2065 RepID=A0A9W6V0R6_9ACTN|nr:YcnI family protein [Kitasatospora phosalacinea]GLW68507.1 membrane protein [Kitasatospora phosalacinea]
MRSLSARRSLGALALAAGALLASAVPASAHVTVQSNSAQQGGYTAVAFRVPNESDTASTVKVEVNLPLDHPMASVRTQPVPGWTAVMEKSKLDKPLSSHGQQITEAVSKITWTANDGTRIGPGQYQDFAVSLGALPTDTEQLTFKALQTYDNGDVVRWIEEAKDGQPEPSKPAPTLKLTKAAGAASAAADHHSTDSSGTQQAAASDAKASDATARTLGVVGIVVGVVGAALGVAGLRRRSAQS